jgi:hypothetical protein
VRGQKAEHFLASYGCAEPIRPRRSEDIQTDLVLANSPISRQATGVVMARGEPLGQRQPISERSMARLGAHEGALRVEVQRLGTESIGRLSSPAQQLLCGRDQMIKQ